MNLHLFFEHIASVSGRDIREVRRELTPEHWKDMCDFGTFRGYKLFREYVHGRNRTENLQKVTGFESWQNGFCLRIPQRDFDSSANLGDRATLYLETYAEKFMEENREFEYPTL